jgi:hypothetical protein
VERLLLRRRKQSPIKDLQTRKKIKWKLKKQRTPLQLMNNEKSKCFLRIKKKKRR